MSQQIQINYGAAPNDGSGDPLRTAFIKTDENFDNIWLAGPVGSNVTIVNNTISVVDTNGNLILSPNGIGAIQTNNRLLPRATLSYDIGSQALRYRNVYAAGVDVANAVLGNLSNITITVANLHVLDGTAGYVLQTDGTGNLTWVASNGVPGGVNTQVQFNNAGSFGAQTGFTFNKTSNLLSVPGNITTTGNITGNYFLGNGSQLTGIAVTYGNSNVTTLLASLGSNIISGTGNITTTGNITGNYFLGNGSQLTGLAVTYGNANVVANLAALGTNPITTTGNITGNYFLGNGSQLTGIAASYGNANVVANLAALGTNPISTAGNITTTANISGSYILGSGSQLTNLPAPVVTQDITSNGAMSIMTYDGTIKYVSYATVEPSSGNISAGNVLTTGNVSGNYFIGNGSQLTGISSAGTGNVTFNDINIIGTGNLRLQPDPANSSAYLDIYLTTGPDIHIAGNGETVILGTDDFANITVNVDGNVSIQASNGTPHTWTFDTAGNLTLPGNIIAINYLNGNRVIGDVTFSGEAVIGTGTSNTQSGLYLAPDPVSLTNDLYLRVRGNIYDEPTHIHFDTGNNQYYNQFIGDDNKYIQLANTGNIVVNSNDGAGNSAQWTFGAAGKITLPYNAVIKDTVYHAVAFGEEAGKTNQGQESVAIGHYAGRTTQGSGAVAIGVVAGNTSQGQDSVAIGSGAGRTSQAQSAVAIGSNAGSSYQGEDSIAIGYQAGYHDQQRGVAIGYQAGVGGTLYRSVSDAQGGSGPVTTYSPSAPPDPSRLYVASTTNIVTNQRVFGNNIQANTLVTAVYPGEDRVDITPNYTAAMTDGDPLTFVGVVIGINDANNVVYPMRVTGTNIPTNTFVQSTGCSVVTLSQYPTAPLTDGASLVFNIGQGPYSTAVGYQAGSSFQDDNAVAVGREAGFSNQGPNAVAVGAYAGYSTQGARAVAVGTNAGEFTQAVNAVAVGYKAGYSTQGARAVAIGEDAGYNTQGEDAVAVGQKAGFSSQGPFAVAIGNRAGRSGQLDAAVAIGYGTGAVSQGYSAVAIGANAASYAQGSSAVAIGELSGNTSQGADSVAVGYRAGLYNQLPAAVAIGYAAGQNFQGTQAVAIGDSAGAAGTTFGILYQSGSGTAITISPNADIRIGQRITGDFVPDDTFVVNIDPTGEFLDLSQAITGTPDPGTEWTAWQPQGIAAVAIGYAAGQNLQGNSAVAVGDHSGYQDQGINAVAVGYNAGYNTQGTRAVAIGEDAGYNTQGEDAVAVGNTAGNYLQGNSAVAVGDRSGGYTQGNSAVAVGLFAGNYLQGANAVAVGNSAGYTGQGTAAIAIGTNAGVTNQGNNSIIINATAANLNQTTANTFTVAPVRNDVANTANVMFYNATSKEITYGNTISVAGNITGGNVLFGSGIVSGTGNITGGNLLTGGLISATANITGGNVLFGSGIVSGTGNITGGNILGGANVNATTHTGTTVSVTGNITGGNVLFGSGIVSGTGNITGGNILTGGLISATANITGGNLNAAGLSLSGNVVSALNVTSNIAGGNITTPGLISATGNITGGNILGGANVNATTHTGTTVSVTGNITGGNILGGANVNATTHTGTTVSVTGNITGGNILGGANVNATTHTGTTVSVTGNITGGNILFGSGIVSGTGNITGGNLISSALTSTASLSVTGNTATITTANYSVGYLNIPQISFAANATAALVDSGKHYYTTSASNLALTLADNSAVSWPVGTALSIVNRGTANVTVAPAAGVSLYLAGNSSSANRVVTTYGMATVMNVAANIWMISGTVV